jgi:TolB protein
MKYRKLISILTILPLAFFGLVGCTEELYYKPEVIGKIVGKVINYDTKNPEAGVLLTLNPTGKSYETDSTGFFQFDSLVNGKYTIQSRKEGLFTEFVTVEIIDGISNNTTIYLGNNVVSNVAPNQPQLLTPKKNEILTSERVFLSWKGSDADRFDTLRYDVVLFKEGDNPGHIYIENWDHDTLSISNLIPNSVYYWQIVAKDRTLSTRSEVFSFKTPPYPELNYLFTRVINGENQIFGQNSTNNVIRQLTSKGNNWRPIGNPKRDEIAFISNQYRGENHLFLISTDGTGLRRVTTDPISSPYPSEIVFTWSTDGSSLIFPSYNSIYSINRDGTGLKKLHQTSNGRIVLGCDYNEKKNIILARTIGDSKYDSEIIFFDGNKTNVIFKENRIISTPNFDVTGDYIVFSKDFSDYNDYAGRVFDSRLVYMSLKDNSMTDLSSVTNNNTGNNVNNSQNSISKDLGTNDLEPRFSPNNKFIIFTNTQNDNLSTNNIFTIDIFGHQRTIHISNANMGFWRSH